MRRVAWLAIALLAALAPSGCSKSDSGPTGPGTTAAAPEPTSPAGVVARLAWAFARRDTAVNQGLYTLDYEYLLHPTDAGTRGDTDGLLVRAEEVAFMDRWIRRPVLATFAFTDSLRETDDTRPGKDPRFHRRIDTGALIQVDDGAVRYEIRGGFGFFLVRGDSAAIDDGTRVGPTLPDSTRWYVERVEDGARGGFLRSHADRAQPAVMATLGGFKLMVLEQE